MNIVPITINQNPYSHCIETLYFVESANDLSLNTSEQLKQILRQAEIQLALAGCAQKHLMSVSMYLKDFEDIEAINTIWYEWKQLHCKTTRACFKAEMSHPDCLVEVSFMVCQNHLQTIQA